MSAETTARFTSFAEFYPYYLQEHSNDTCRRLHYVGSLLVLSILAYAIGGINPSNSRIIGHIAFNLILRYIPANQVACYRRDARVKLWRNVVFNAPQYLQINRRAS